METAAAAAVRLELLFLLRHNNHQPPMPSTTFNLLRCVAECECLLRLTEPKDAVRTFVRNDSFNSYLFLGTRGHGGAQPVIYLPLCIHVLYWLVWVSGSSCKCPSKHSDHCDAPCHDVPSQTPLQDTHSRTQTTLRGGDLQSGGFRGRFSANCFSAAAGLLLSSWMFSDPRQPLMSKRTNRAARTSH